MGLSILSIPEQRKLVEIKIENITAMDKVYFFALNAKSFAVSTT